MDDLDALEFSGADFVGVEPADATRKLGAIEVADAHDIALGNLDLCLGDLWDTAERRSFGTVAFIQVTSEDMYLVGRVEDNRGWSYVHE